jgi:hypothetical protein
MSNREIIFDILSKLPEDAPLQDIAREIEFLAGIQTAREQARRREGIPAEDARELVKTWAGR